MIMEVDQPLSSEKSMPSEREKIKNKVSIYPIFTTQNLEIFKKKGPPKRPQNGGVTHLVL